jgi:ankyrin repeat protein
VVQLLLEHGATAVMDSVVHVRYCDRNDCGCYSRTALMMCTDTDTVKVLLAAGADVHVTNSVSDTCLHLAVRHKLAVPVLCLLIKAGVDVHAVNNEGKTAAQLAHDRSYTLIEQLLNRAAQQQQQ